MNRRLLMIGGWTEIYRKAKLLGYDLTLVQEREKLRAEDYRHAGQLLTSALDSPELPDIAQAIHSTRPFDVVVSFQEMGVLNAARIQDRLGIAGNLLRPVLLTRNKTMMREHLRKCGVPSIPFLHSNDPQALADFGHAVGWPIILKPNCGAGSSEIHKLDSVSGIEKACASIARQYPGDLPLAEKFIVGKEVSVEAISWNGCHHVLGVTEKITTGAPHFVETGHNMPFDPGAGMFEKIRTLTTLLLDSIEHRYGPSHTEMILSDDGPCIIESHTRTGGDYIFEMVEHVYGVDMFDATLRGFLGDFPAISTTARCAAAVRYLLLPEGIISSVAGVSAAAQSSGIVRCDIDLAPGARVGKFSNSDERYGCVVASGRSQAEAILNADAAIGKLQIVVASPSTPGSGPEDRQEILRNSTEADAGSEAAAC